MAFSIVAQMDLTARPYTPEMIVGGELLYRSAPSVIRKATMGGSDVLLATLTSFNVNHNPVNQRGSISQGDYFIVADALVTATVPFYMNAIHRITGAISTAGPFTNSQSSGYLVRGLTLVMIYTLDLSTAGVREIRVDVPITFSVNIPQGMVPFNLNNNPGGTTDPIAEFQYIQGDLNTTDVAGGTAIPLFRIKADAPYTSTRIPAGVWKTKTGFGVYIYADVETGSKRIPVNWVGDGTYIYGLCVNVSTGTVNWWRGTIASLPALYTTQEFQNLGLGASTGTGYQAKAINFNQLFGRIYFTAADPHNKIYSSIPWPLSLATNIVLGAATADAWHQITGIWTFPPYVYASVINNVGPPVVPNRLYKIYDSALDASLSQRFPSGGGKDEEAYIMSILR